MTPESPLPPGLVILDGATGTELDRRGVDVGLPLWSAGAVTTDPDAVRRTHEAYLRAGADAITTCTFRTNRRTLERAGRGNEADALTHRAVTLAAEARDAVAPSALILGSVAPLEECYAPELAPDPATCAREHEWLMTALLDAGVDLLLLETMGTVREIVAATGVAQRLAPGRWMLGMCTRHDGPPGHLLSGESVTALAAALEPAAAIGLNCVAAPRIESELLALRGTAPSVRRLAYANIGYADPMGNWVSTDAVEPAQYLDCAGRWLDAGATIIGGCCGTTPATVSALCRLREHGENRRQG